jgi:hypothetical protein
MKPWQSIAVAVSATILSWGAAASAQAFNIMTHSEDPLLSDEVLRSAVLQTAASVGNNIPDNPNVKVYVSSKARPTKLADGTYVYLHRIELRRAFNAGPPYPYAGWLPVESREEYGVGGPEEVRAKLDQALRDFFTQLKQDDPQTGFK